MNERLLTLCMAIAALAISILLLSPHSTSSNHGSLPTSEDSGNNGLQVLADWLRQQNVPVISLRNRLSQLPHKVDARRKGHVLIMSLPARTTIEKAEWKALQEWLQQGNGVLILGHALLPAAWADDEHCFCNSQDFLARFDWSLAREDSEQDEPTESTQASADDLQHTLNNLQQQVKAMMNVEGQLKPIAGQPLTRDVHSLSSQWLPKSLQRPWLLTTDSDRNLALKVLQEPQSQTVVFWQMSAGNGQIFLSLAGDLFSNQRLGQRDNAVFLSNLLGQTLASGASVVFDDYHFGLSELYDAERFFHDPRLHQTLMLLGLMWLIYVVGYSNRLAPVRASTPPLSASAMIEVSAGFFARRVDQRTLQQEQLRLLLLDIRHARHLSDDSQVWSWLAQHPQIDTAQLRRLRRIADGKRLAPAQACSDLSSIRHRVL